MIDFLIGLALTGAIIVFLELFGKVDRKLMGAFTLSGIAFIYTGFACPDPLSLTVTILGVTFFLALAYLGYKKSIIWISAGLILHGMWDVVYPLFLLGAPPGYDVFCITIDLFLAVYFYLRLRPLETREKLQLIRN